MGVCRRIDIRAAFVCRCRPNPSKMVSDALAEDPRISHTPSIPSCAWAPFAFMTPFAREFLSCALTAAGRVWRRLSGFADSLSRESPLPTLASERESS